MSEEEAQNLVETLERIVTETSNKIEEMLKHDPVR